MKFDYTNQGRRPSAAQIVSDWRKAGKPDSFYVTYGETFAEFDRSKHGTFFGHQWRDSGNGCRGVDRAAVLKLLEAA
jgi:hypothetical protein